MTPLFHRRSMLAALGALGAAAGALAVAPGAAAARAVSPGDDPEPGARVAAPYPAAANWPDALRRWQRAEHVNAWIGTHFEYDRARAIALSETERARGAAVEIHAPAAFFAAPRGVCVDLARFAVETLRVVEPGARPAYLMIEFAPTQIAGRVLRRHWVALVHRADGVSVLADSKRPGQMSGPYASVRDYVDAYAAWRGREIVAWRETDSYQRRTRSAAARTPRADPPAPSNQERP